MRELNGFYKGYVPSAWRQEELTFNNCPIRIGRATVLPGDLVIAHAQGVIFVRAILAETAISSVERTRPMDEYDFLLNQEGKNRARFEGGWNAEKFAGFAQWVAAHPDKLKMAMDKFEKPANEKMGPANHRQRPSDSPAP